MNVIDTEIDGVKIIEPKIFEDSRGYFFESFNELEFAKKNGLVNLYRIMNLNPHMVL